MKTTSCYKLKSPTPKEKYKKINIYENQNIIMGLISSFRVRRILIILYLS